MGPKIIPNWSTKKGEPQPPRKRSAPKPPIKFVVSLNGHQGWKFSDYVGFMYSINSISCLSGNNARNVYLFLHALLYT